MRIDLKRSKLSSAPLAGVMGFLAIIGICGFAYAADGSGAAPDAITAAQPATSLPSIAPPPPAAMAPSPAPSVSMASAMPPSLDDKEPKNLSSLEGTVTDSVKTVVKGFTSPTQKVTMDDLNSVKVAIAKLDALIDIEKKMNELEKVRSEREGKPMAVSAIPASALAPPSPPIKMAPITPTVAPIVLRRVAGSAGRNVAVVEQGGEEKTFRIGDKLSDGSVVTSISASGIDLNRNGVSRRIEMKNVDIMYGRTF